MAHGFSLQSVKDMEFYIDGHLAKLLSNLAQRAKTGEVFDFKELIAFYVLDVLGELAFSQSFDAQTEQIPEKLPPINDHIFLACLMGMMPEVLPYLRAVAAWTPLPWVQQLFKARAQLKTLTAQCVRRRLNEKLSGRKDLLSSLINAVDPVTGAKLTELDINTEAFAMV
jgi:cytochrome P450